MATPTGGAPKPPMMYSDAIKATLTSEDDETKKAPTNMRQMKRPTGQASSSKSAAEPTHTIPGAKTPVKEASAGTKQEEKPAKMEEKKSAGLPATPWCSSSGKKLPANGTTVGMKQENKPAELDDKNRRGSLVPSRILRVLAPETPPDIKQESKLASLDHQKTEDSSSKPSDTHVSEEAKNAPTNGDRCTNNERAESTPTTASTTEMAGSVKKTNHSTTGPAKNLVANPLTAPGRIEDRRADDNGNHHADEDVNDLFADFAATLLLDAVEKVTEDVGQDITEGEADASEEFPFELLPSAVNADKGYGFFATKSIPRGTCIIAERPMVWIPPPSGHTEELNLIRDRVKQLSPAQYEILHDLYRNPEKVVPGWGLTIRKILSAFPEHKSGLGLADSITLDTLDQAIEDMAIFRSNACRMTSQQEDNSLIGLFPIFSRLNHSCVPNVSCFWNESIGEETVYTTRVIDKGEELFRGYNSNASRTKEMRAAELWQNFAFVCDCPACVGPGAAASNSRRRRMFVVDQMFAIDQQPLMESRDASEMLEEAEMMLGLYRDEGLTDYSLAVVYHECAKYSMQAGKTDKAIEYAEKQLEVQRYCKGMEEGDGPDKLLGGARDFLDMLHYLRNEQIRKADALIREEQAGKEKAEAKRLAKKAKQQKAKQRAKEKKAKAELETEGSELKVEEKNEDAEED